MLSQKMDERGRQVYCQGRGKTNMNRGWCGREYSLSKVYVNDWPNLLLLSIESKNRNDM